MQEQLSSTAALSNKEAAIQNIKRRTFITTLTKAAGGAALLSVPFMGKGNIPAGNTEAVTVGSIIDLFIKEVPGAPFANTVDTLKSGSRDMVVTGIVTTMFATVEVIKKAIDAGANFIIAHEPTFYNHADETNWLKDDDVYHYKANLLNEHNITVWRNHDYIHSLPADGVREGVLAQLSWKQYDDGKGENVLLPQAVSLAALINYLKAKMGIRMVRYIGSESELCKKILLMPGAAGGKAQIEAISKNKPDVLVCGEIQEWETAEYVRDARAEGLQLSLVVLGHIASEEPGSVFMANWLQKNVPGIAVTHIPANNALQFG